MALTTSNTYIEPTNATSLNASRAQYNNSLRSLLTNFYSTSPPTTVNIVSAGANLGEVDGMLFRSITNKALYISDSVNKKTSPVGGNFTRIGIGNRNENGIQALAANIGSYEIGELVSTVSSDGTLASNARLYLITSNTGTMSSVLDVGAPQAYSVSTNDNVTFSGQSVKSIRLLATSNIAVGTDSPETDLHVVGGAKITEAANIIGALGVAGDTYLQKDVYITGNVTSSQEVTAFSDRRLKKDIEPIRNALETVKKLSGVSYTKDGGKHIGLIAQDVQPHLPEVVHEGEEYLSIAYGSLTSILIEAIKEIDERLEILENADS